MWGQVFEIRGFSRWVGGQREREREGGGHITQKLGEMSWPLVPSVRARVKQPGAVMTSGRCATVMPVGKLWRERQREDGYIDRILREDRFQNIRGRFMCGPPGPCYPDVERNLQRDRVARIVDDDGPLVTTQKFPEQWEAASKSGSVLIVQEPRSQVPR